MDSIFQSPSALFVPFMVMLGYFLLFRPEMQRKEALEALRAALKPGDSVILSNGIFGTIVKIEDSAVQVKIATSVTIKVLKTAIESRVEEPAEVSLTKS